jgi:hypothetical protein
MIETSTVKLIILVLLALTIIWLLRTIFRKEYESLFRVILVCLILGGALYLVQQSKSEKFSISEIKRSLFPAKTQTYRYEVEQISDSKCYVFLPPNPKLALSMDSGGKYFHITDVDSLNAILKSINLPAVSSGAKELASITGKRTDMNMYQWQDYPLGKLILERGIYTDTGGLTSYNCITSITIKQRY